MIIHDGKLTSIEDIPANLLEAAHDAAFGRGGEFVSEKHGLSIRAENGTAHTESEELFTLALQDGWWIEPHPLGGYEILFNWPKDPASPPNNQSVHITRTVISLAEAERRWKMTNLRQPAYRGRVDMWKSGKGTWLTTVTAMDRAFGRESEQGLMDQE